MTIKQLQRYKGKLVSVTWIDSGMGFDGDDPPEKLSLAERTTTGIMLYAGPYLGPPEKGAAVDICVIAHEQPAREGDDYSDYEGTVVWVPAIQSVKGQRK